MTPDDLARVIQGLLAELAPGGEADLPSVDVRRPRDPGHGQWTTPIALRAASVLGVTPRFLAAELAGRLRDRPGVAAVRVTGPGFLAVDLDDAGEDLLGRLLVGVPVPCGPQVPHVPVVGVATEPLRRHREAVLAHATARVRAAVDVTDGSCAVTPAGAVGEEGPVGPCRLVRGGRPLGLTAAEIDALDHDGRLSYHLLRHPIAAHVTLDATAIHRRTPNDPLFQVRYAHARACTLLRLAARDGLTPDGGGDLDHAAPGALQVLTTLGETTRILHLVAARGETVRLTRHLEDAAATFHRWHDTSGLRPGLPGPHPGEGHRRAGVLVAEAVRVTLSGTLALLGVDAPERC